MTTFAPVAALAGGAMIGLSAALLMAVEGRIAGISGMIGRLLPPWDRKAAPPRLAFILGLAAAPLAAWAVTGAPVTQTVSTNLPLMAAAGLLVGFGAAWGNGCTSGHGICGLARLSPRSLLATAVFVTAALAAAAALRHIAGN